MLYIVSIIFSKDLRIGTVINFNQAGFLVLPHSSFDIYEWDGDTETLMITSLKQNEELMVPRVLGVKAEADLFCQ